MGVHPKVVQEMLGHSQIAMTREVYFHDLPSLQEEVTKQWGSEFGQQVKIGIRNAFLHPDQLVAVVSTSASLFKTDKADSKLLLCSGCNMVGNKV
jgi:hypothetical protein